MTTESDEGARHETVLMEGLEQRIVAEIDKDKGLEHVWCSHSVLRSSRIYNDSV